jgi:hypothetical protein
MKAHHSTGYLNGPHAEEGGTTPIKRLTQIMVRPKDRRRKPLKKADDLEAENATWDGTQT